MNRSRVFLATLVLALAGLILGACSRGSGPDLPSPAGASQGLNTFVFFATDN